MCVLPALLAMNINMATGFGPNSGGGRPVCFQGSLACVDLASVQSTHAQRVLLNATCDPSSPYHFNWGTASVDPCDFAQRNWEDEACSQFLKIPGVTKEFWADIAAVRMQNWFAFPDSIGGTSKGIPGMLERHDFTLPANYEIPLTLISSGFNRLRDLVNTSRALNYACDGNAAPTAANYDPRHPASKIVFSGVDGQTSGKRHPPLPHCGPRNRTNATRFVVADYTSTSLLLELAAAFAGPNGSMLVWETTSAGNQPFSGDEEWVVPPGATFKQLRCDLFTPSFPVPDSPFDLAAISFAYETTTLGELPAEEEGAILRRSRDAFYNYTAQ